MAVGKCFSHPEDQTSSNLSTTCKEKKKKNRGRKKVVRFHTANTLFDMAARDFTLSFTCSMKFPAFNTSKTNPFSHASVASILWFSNNIDTACNKMTFQKQRHNNLPTELYRKTGMHHDLSGGINQSSSTPEEDLKKAVEMLRSIILSQVN